MGELHSEEREGWRAALIGGSWRRLAGSGFFGGGWGNLAGSLSLGLRWEWEQHSGELAGGCPLGLAAAEAGASEFCFHAWSDYCLSV